MAKKRSKNLVVPILLGSTLLSIGIASYLARPKPVPIGINEVSGNIDSTNNENYGSKNSLIAQWNFNEVSGNTASNNDGSCGNLCTGTLTNFSNTSTRDSLSNSGWTSNKILGSGSVAFDGIDDYIKIDNFDTTGITSASVETWIKTTEGNKKSLILQFQGLMLYINRFTPGKIFIGFDDTSGNNSQSDESKTSIVDGKWHHIVGTNNGTMTSIYIDGKLETTYSDTLATGPQPIIFGSNIGSDLFFNGTIDFTRVYSRVLNENEIKNNYDLIITSNIKPPTPSNTKVTCSPDGTSVKFSWDSVSEVESYKVRLDDKNGKVTNYDDIKDLQKVVSVTPGKTYSWWMHSHKGSYDSNQTSTVDFTCNNTVSPTPKPTVKPTVKPVVTKGDEVYVADDTPTPTPRASIKATPKASLSTTPVPSSLVNDTPATQVSTNPFARFFRWLAGLFE